MENPRGHHPKKDIKNATILPLAIPEEEPVQKSMVSDAVVPGKIKILEPSEQGDNWDEKIPKEGYDTDYPNMPTSGGTLL